MLDLGFFYCWPLSHPTVWRAIDSLKKDQATVATDLLQHQRGETLKKRTRSSADDANCATPKKNYYT